MDFIHEPVLSGAFPGQAETTYVLTENPTFYLTNPAQLTAELNCLPPFDGTNCQTTDTPAGDGSFSQNVQRLGLYAMDAWRVTPQLTINYGLRWDTTFGLFQASGVSQLFNPGVQTITRTATAPAVQECPRTTARPSLRAWGLPILPTTSRTWSSALASACTTAIWRRTDGQQRSRP